MLHFTIFSKISNRNLARIEKKQTSLENLEDNIAEQEELLEEKRTQESTLLVLHEKGS